MAKISKVSIKCPKCGTRFPSPIFIGDTEGFESSVLQGNRAQCPNAECRTMIACNKENMSYTEEEGGGFVGNDFGR